MKEVSALKTRTEEGSVSVAVCNTKSKNNIVSPLYIEGSTALKTEAPLEPDQLPVSIEQIFPTELKIKSGVGTLFKAIRIHHWTKNLLVFVPLLLASTPTPSSLLFSAALAFLCLSLCASSVYVLNALMDLEWDLPILTGVWSVSLLLLASVALSLFLPSGFLLVLAAYFVLTLAYTLYLEQNMLADALLLALLHFSCIIAGAMAVEILSPWLLALSLFWFLSFAFLKRCSIWLILLWAWGFF